MTQSIAHTQQQVVYIAVECDRNDNVPKMNPKNCKNASVLVTKHCSMI